MLINTRLVIGDCFVSLQAVLDYTYHDETHLTDEEFPEKDSRERIANIFGMSEVTSGLAIWCLALAIEMKISVSTKKIMIELNSLSTDD